MKNVAFTHRKYRAPSPFPRIQRKWPDRTLNSAPDWCSVDLRDGNQALIEPMSPDQKLKMFELLVDIGFREIEVGFPAASTPDFDFVRKLIEERRIPEQVTIQVLTPARESLIKRSFEALRGAPRAIVHLYNSTSAVQRDEVFRMSPARVRDLAVQGARWVNQEAERYSETAWQFQYSPESFTGTEMPFALSVCNAVIAEWKPCPERPAIINLPATVEVATPNVYADQIEWMCEHLDRRESIRVSLHTHNDRGCGVAAAELGTLAGADRVEGTLLGNGERTGNMCLVTMAMNLYSQGVDPRLCLADMDRIRATVEQCTQITVHPRHPYAGDLVFAAFSGSHQDAINKCLKADRKRRAVEPEVAWQVAYLPIDPQDVGRSYQEVVRVNSQSGKGGTAFILEQQFGMKLPPWLQVDFSPHVQEQAEVRGEELSGERIRQVFERAYQPELAPRIAEYNLSREGHNDQLEFRLTDSDKIFKGEGSGPLEALSNALGAALDESLVILSYEEHSLGADQGAEAIAYVQLGTTRGRSCGAARSRDVTEASLQAVLNALARSDGTRRLVA